jgi:Nucleotidyl transferase AbiEii toxin, Type IV TA system
MPSFPVPDRPHNDDWKVLLRQVFPVIDEVAATRGVTFPVQIGGGSMLLKRYRHRRSRDLDLFVTDARLVRWCSPRVNAAAADLFPDYAEEPLATKLIVGMQEIDIIVAAPVTEHDHVEAVTLFGRDVLIERPREILAKKLVYRGRRLQPRDLFDIACVARAEPDEVATILPWLSVAQLQAVSARLSELEPVAARDLAHGLEPYPEFSGLRADCLEIVRDIVGGWRSTVAGDGS